MGVEDNPQLCVTEKSVEETDKQEKVPDVSVQVEDNPQICVAEKSVEETDKQEKFLMLVWGLYRTHKMVLRKSLLRRQINQKQNKVVLGLKITHKMVYYGKVSW